MSKLRERFDSTPRVLASLAEWFPLPLVLPFFVLFLITALGRIHAPFNLEWNEGQSAEQALRVAQGLSMFPRPEENWVPYMYAPFYHIAWGAWIGITGSTELFWGRAISLISSLATGLAIGWIVFDRTAKRAPAAIAGLLFFAYYEAAGYWFDIARNDALAFGLCSWAMYFTLKQRPRPWQIVFGMILFLFATLTKQTAGPIAIFSTLWLLIGRNTRRAALLGGGLVAVLTAAFLLLMQFSGNDQFLKYVVENAMRHPTKYDVLMPDDDAFRTVLRSDLPLSQWPTVASDYIRLSIEKPPRIWNIAGQHVYVLFCLILAWLLVAWRHRRWPPGGLFLFPAALLSWGTIVGLAKFGGYVNNLVPMFMGLAIVTGFAIDSVYRATTGSWKLVSGAAVSGALFLQLYQPWNLRDPIEPATAGQITWKIRDEALKREVQAYASYLRREAERNAGGSAQSAARSGGRAGEAAFSARAARRFTLGRWAAAGLAWFPADQQPDPNAWEVHERFLDWLRAKRRAGESVWVMHHQLFGYQTGHPTGINVDMVRCANWAGDPTPNLLLEDLRSGKFDWLVLDKSKLEYEWAAPGVRVVIEENYDSMGRLPAFEGFSDTALKPVTGATMNPFWVYRYKGFEGELDAAHES